MTSPAWLDVIGYLFGFLAALILATYLVSAPVVAWLGWQAWAGDERVIAPEPDAIDVANEYAAYCDSVIEVAVADLRGELDQWDRGVRP
jgi:hypothetical protein